MNNEALQTVIEWELLKAAAAKAGLIVVIPEDKYQIEVIDDQGLKLTQTSSMTAARYFINGYEIGRIGK